MEKITCTLQRISKTKLLISIIVISLYSVLSVCFYGFVIGGSQYKISYIFYVLFSSLVISFLLCLFMLGKFFLERINNREYRDGQVFVIIVLMLVVLHFLLYSPLNKLSASDSTAIQYETEIIYVHERNRYIFGKIDFLDSEEKEVSMSCYIPPIEFEPFPEQGGRMIVCENVGGFGVTYYELIKITYMPETIS